MIQVTAPSNLFADGYHADALRGCHYLARMQNRFHSSVFDVHFSLNHRHPRTFRARVHRKDGSRHGDRAIRSTNIQVPGVTLRGLHNDAALIEMDGCITTAGADRQFCALIHFHLRSIQQPHLGTVAAAVQVESGCLGRCGAGQRRRHGQGAAQQQREQRGAGAGSR